MKKPAIMLGFSAIAFLAFILWLVALPHYHIAVCRNHLKQICKMSIIYAGDFNEVYPDTLKILNEFGVKSSILTCPAVKRESNALQDIDHWSGYRLITGIRTESQPTMVFVYCHPENHNGRCGNVAFVDAHVETLKSDEFERLLAEQGIIHRSKEP